MRDSFSTHLGRMDVTVDAWSKESVLHPVLVPVSGVHCVVLFPGRTPDTRNTIPQVARNVTMV